MRRTMLMLLAVAACSGDEVAVRARVPLGGVSVPVPEGYALCGTPEGAGCLPADGEVAMIAGPLTRTPVVLRVRHFSDADAVEAHGLPPMPRRRGRVRYGVTETAGGSGGTAYALAAFRGAGDGFLLVEATQQAEPPARPDFGAAWFVLRETRISD